MWPVKLPLAHSLSNWTLPILNQPVVPAVLVTLSINTRYEDTCFTDAARTQRTVLRVDSGKASLVSDMKRNVFIHWLVLLSRAAAAASRPPPGFSWALKQEKPSFLHSAFLH